MPDERDVITRMKAGDSEAFTVIYKRYWMKVYRFASLYILSGEDVEEIVQDVFVRLWQKRDLLDAERDLDGFLFIVTRNLIFNHTRSNFNHSFYRTTVQEAMEEASYDVEEDLYASDLRRRVDTLVGMLPPRQREVFLLSRKYQLTYKEIANRLHISEKTFDRKK